ncbi:hypothetical protein Q5P01_018468 [Channa striata]|uniref:Uncharacterized protein n=1 Tax=Channa striata TaxID=64152 RepID=A0AA88M5W1_CHASR|nr:hypothetical protein Q5P01_018468 [Channa striata]
MYVCKCSGLYRRVSLLWCNDRVCPAGGGNTHLRLISAASKVQRRRTTPRFSQGSELKVLLLSSLGSQHGSSCVPVIQIHRNPMVSEHHSLFVTVP